MTTSIFARDFSRSLRSAINKSLSENPTVSAAALAVQIGLSADDAMLVRLAVKHLYGDELVARRGRSQGFCRPETLAQLEADAVAE